MISQDSPEPEDNRKSEPSHRASGLALTGGSCAINWRARRGLERSDIPEFPSPGTENRADDGCQGWRSGRKQSRSSDRKENRIVSALQSKSVTAHEISNNNQQMALATNNREKEEVLSLFETYDLLPEEESEEESRAAINPNFDRFDGNTSRNCMYCSEAYDLRRRGFDVKAEEKISSDNGESTDENDFNNPGASSKDKEINTKYYQIYDEENDTYSSETVNKAASNCLKDIQAEGPNARGIFIINWGYDYHGSGHAINWYNYKDSNGKTKTKFVDSQNIEREPTDDCTNYAGEADKIGWYRTDNQIPVTNDISKYSDIRSKVVPVNKPYLEDAPKKETLADKIDKKAVKISKKIASTNPWLEDKFK